MNKFLFIAFVLIIAIYFFSEVSAICNEGQININSASLEKLDGLAGIGPVKAQAIIDTRPFNNIDELINVSGIGAVTLLNIKQQGLACVNDEGYSKNIIVEQEEQPKEEEIIQEEQKAEEEIQEEVDETNLVNDNVNNEPSKDNNLAYSQNSETPLIKNEPIILSSKSIKSEIDKEKSNKNWSAIYGLTIFCILLAILFLIRIGKNGKSEFR